MTFSLRRKPRTTRPAKSTPSRTACSLLVAAGLALAGSAAAQDGQPRSSFRPRTDAPATLVLPVQAKTDPKGTVPGTVQPGKDTPKGPGADPLPGIIPPKGPGVPDVGAALPPPAVRPDPYEAYIRLEPPGRERLFGSRDTEKELEERMRQERRDTGGPGEIQFPEKPDLPRQTYEARRFAPMVELAEPSYVVYRRLYFEEKNAERYGWDLGIAQPVVSTLAFFRDTLLFPHNFASYPCRRFDTSAGHCLPGDPVPLIAYPPEFTGTGLLAEVGMVALLFYAIP